MKARPHQPTPFRLGLGFGANSPPRLRRAVSVARSLRSFAPHGLPPLLMVGAPSPLFAPPLVLRPHPASKRGPPSLRSLAGCRLVRSRQGGGRELSFDWEIERNLQRYYRADEYTFVFLWAVTVSGRGSSLDVGIHSGFIGRRNSLNCPNRTDTIRGCPSICAKSCKRRSVLL